MNRIIKFRAWDKKDKILYQDIWNLQWCIGGIRFGWSDYENSDGETMITDLVDGSYELMQFTGLKDKNGEEIYEGDIVRDVAGFNVEVRWENGREGYIPFSIGRGERNPNECEVIGNIFEDNNLLNKEK